MKIGFVLSGCGCPGALNKDKIELSKKGTKLDFLQGLASSSSSDEDSVEPLVTFTQEVREISASGKRRQRNALNILLENVSHFFTILFFEMNYVFLNLISEKIRI